MFGHWTYLIFEVGWGLPVLVLHWLVGRRVLWPRVRLIALAAGLPTLYLSAADSVAIGQGIWLLHANRIIGIHAGNVPLEEVVFFALTNLMVVQSLLLLRAFLRPPLAGRPRTWHLGVD